MLTSYVYFPAEQFWIVLAYSHFFLVKTDTDKPLYPSEKQIPKIVWKRYLFSFKETRSGETLEIT